MKLILVAVILIPVVVISTVLIVLNVKPQCSGVPAATITGPTIFNHDCTDLSQIPAEWIAKVQLLVKLHYAHTSHGEQLTTGLDLIETADPDYSMAIEDFNLPAEAGALCIMNGQKGYHGNLDESYVTPEYYWAENGLNRTRDVLTNNAAINFSMWCWCTQLDYSDESYVQGYLENMSLLEAEYPNVTFIYMTGNAQANGADGYNRFLRNQYIRDYCKNNSKYLFDFADIDSWYNGYQCTYLYDGVYVPEEHPHFHNPEGPAHTTYASCQLKGAVVWWMFARILGWTGPS
ncbi:MAG: hypothetical protein LUQ65_13405 [Candidatus Helarchaeota archaeon]|nr:hypothetical protein [Candidatus Helarchaeota archaeon]